MPETKLGTSRNEESDENLMARYANDDTRAFEEIFRRYEPRAYGFFAKRSGSAQRAEDLYQELFLRIHRARDTYDPSRPFAPWFFQIAHRLWVDDIRREFRRREVPLDAPGLERVLEDRDDLEAALGALSQEELYVLVSSKVGGAKYSAIAETLGKSVEAVRKMASRALQRIGNAGTLRQAER